MAIPDYENLMLPFLKCLSDGQEHSNGQVVEDLAAHFQLTQEERRQMLPSGTKAVFRNRVGWAKTYLKQAGLIEVTKRAHFRISDRGKQVLRQNPTEINVKFLRQFDEFKAFQKRNRKKDDDKGEKALDKVESATPEESLEIAYETLRTDLANELIQTLKTCPASFFERVVVDLLVKMGYGGSRKDAGEAVGRTRDEGIDGIIKEDRLGLGIIYIQAKRWDGTVGRPEIQKFAGALQGKRATRGIFITTSDFSKDAIEYAGLINTKIVLIDGEQLAQFMIDYNVGVALVQTYEVKRIDTDYFLDE